ncbi:uncharacterized protein FIBRA_02466 [Fibroporia radiculosa]|uniref:Eukaryotic translation initiation factor 3 subunit M n=1 Tax=Fibroporia radiculosa TaxID=599839 RepID=J4H1V5_9APHY|nr:uncharacterized protein FIBRA_02466 [Fibroporia radiculosa]CCM00434.1 predicted protein [Fibroporia radiculosa]
MVATDAVSVFTEGTFSEQIRELVDYLARSQPEEAQPAYVQPFAEILETTEGQVAIEEDQSRREKVFIMVLDEVKGLGEGSEKEMEGFFNLLFSHLVSLLALDAAETREHITILLQTIATSSDQTLIKYRILSNFFNTLPRPSSLRLLVYRTLLEIASAHDELGSLNLSRTEVEKWLQEWDVSSEEKSAFLQHVAASFSKCGCSEISYEYFLSYVRSLPSSSSSAQSAAIDAIAAALRLPHLFDFDALFRLDAVVAAKDHELFSLLHIFLNNDLHDYKAWAESHADAFTKYDLDKAQLERKIRLLTLATLGFQNIGHDVPYSSIASALEVDSSQVERWVIDGEFPPNLALRQFLTRMLSLVIRAGLLSGRLSQTTQTLHVSRAAARAFDRPQWETLEKRLLSWKAGLASVLDVVAAARKKGGAEVVVNGAASVPTAIEPAPQAAATAA